MERTHGTLLPTVFKTRSIGRSDNPPGRPESTQGAGCPRPGPERDRRRRIASGHDHDRTQPVASLFLRLGGRCGARGPFTLIAHRRRLAARFIGPLLPFSFRIDPAEGAVDELLLIIATAMLTVSTFSVTAMVTRVLLGDDDGHPPLHATAHRRPDVAERRVDLVGAFAFSLVASSPCPPVLREPGAHDPLRRDPLDNHRDRRRHAAPLDLAPVDLRADADVIDRVEEAATSRSSPTRRTRPCGRTPPSRSPAARWPCTPTRSVTSRTSTSRTRPHRPTARRRGARAGHPRAHRGRARSAGPHRRFGSDEQRRRCGGHSASSPTAPTSRTPASASHRPDRDRQPGAVGGDDDPGTAIEVIARPAQRVFSRALALRPEV